MKKHASVPDTLFACFRRLPELLPELLPGLLPEFRPEFQPELLPELLPEFQPKFQPELQPKGKAPARRSRNILPRAGNYSMNLLLNGIRI